MDYNVEIVDNLQAPVQNPHEDRITAILQKRAHPAPQMVSPQEFDAYGIGNIASRSGPQAFLQAMQGLQQSREDRYMAQQDRELQGAQTLYNIFEEKRALGDKQAQALFDRISMFTGGDPQGTSLFLNELHNDPESIDPGNAYQVMTKLAGIAKKTGYQSPESQMQKLQLQKTRAELAEMSKPKPNLPQTQGLPTGQMWSQDAAGNPVAVPIPGVQQARGDFKEYQLKPAGYAARMVNTENILSALPADAQEANRGASGYTASVLGAIPSMGLGETIGQGVTSLAASPAQQQYLNAAQEWIRAKLRKESGAVISPSEMAQEYATYFPKPTDTKELIAQKALLRQQAVESMIKESNGAFEEQYPDLRKHPSNEGVMTTPSGIQFRVVK